MGTIQGQGKWNEPTQPKQQEETIFQDSMVGEQVK